MAGLGYTVVSGAAALSGVVAQAGISEATGLLDGVLGNKKGNDGDIKYYYNSNRGGNFLANFAAPIGRAAAQYAKDYAIGQLNKLADNALNKLFRKQKKEFQGSQWATLIEEYEANVSEKKYGMLAVNDGKNYIPAMDKMGQFYPTAFIMGIKLDQPISYSVYNVAKRENGFRQSGYTPKEIELPKQTDTLVWYDVSAIPTINSDKNVLLTPVQGRDYTRKEIIGNGDIKFSVTGRMSSGVPGVYPENEVRKFIQIMKYKGIVRCNHFILGILGIDKFIITSWSLSPRQGFGDNVQDYTFSAVGVMPDKQVKVDADTINILDYSIQQEKPQGKWAKLLENKLRGIKNGGINALSAGGSGLISKI